MEDNKNLNPSLEIEPADRILVWLTIITLFLGGLATLAVVLLTAVLF
jgi:hypothetical protein